MSRIGKQPIAVPAKIKVEVKGQKFSVEGPKGKLHWELPKRTSLKVEGENLVVSRDGDDADAGFQVAILKRKRRRRRNSLINSSAWNQRDFRLRGILRWTTV
jgi:large subunit ribosomal protein L6